MSWTVVSSALALALVLCALGALLAVVVSRPRAIIVGTCLTAALAALAVLAAGIALLVGAPPGQIPLPSALPFGPLLLGPDALSALFLCVIGLIGVPVAVYSNHAAYKSLLFLAAGAVDRAAGTRALDRLGGLITRMPWTAALFLVGALAIAGLPPLNGYISEWMTLEVLLRTRAIPDVATRIAVAAGGAAIALTAGLAVTTFVRAFAVGFVGIPRSPEAKAAREVPRSMRLGMGGLGLACLALGILPTFVLPALDRVTAPILGVSVIHQVVPPLFSDAPGPYAPLAAIGGRLFRGLPVNGLVVIAAPALDTITAPTYLLLAEALLAALTLAALRLVRPLGGTRRAAVWAGGIPAFTHRMQYSALAYSNPVRLIFNGFFRSRASFTALRPAARHGDGRIEYAQDVPEPLERELYGPLERVADRLAESARRIQSGSVNRYVGYIFAIVLIVLLLRLL